jgi:hypothetical protein
VTALLSLDPPGWSALGLAPLAQALAALASLGGDAALSAEMEALLTRCLTPQVMPPGKATARDVIAIGELGQLN